MSDKDPWEMGQHCNCGWREKRMGVRCCPNCSDQSLMQSPMRWKDNKLVIQQEVDMEDRKVEDLLKKEGQDAS